MRTAPKGQGRGRAGTPAPTKSRLLAQCTWGCAPGPVSVASQRAGCYSTVTAGPDPQSNCMQGAAWRFTVADMVAIAQRPC